MYSYLFFFLAAVSHAFTETFIFRSDRSVFKNIADKVNPFKTAQTYSNFLGIVRLDPYHIIKFATIFFLIFSIVSVSYFSYEFSVWSILIYGACWFVGFEIFWAKILYRPNK